MQKNPQVALITGAARRIGSEIARVLHAAGINIIVHYHRSAKEAAALCQTFNSKRLNSAVALSADLSDLAAIDILVTEASKVWGQLDILINNASRFYATPIGGVLKEQWEDLMNSNLRAPFFLAQKAIPFLKASQGCIVNIADVHGARPMREHSVYCVTKAGLVMLTQALAKDLAPAIRVNAVSPGAIAWPEGESELSLPAQTKIMERIALRRKGEPSDIAKAVFYLVRDAPYVTGQVLTIDGGRQLFM